MKFLTHILRVALGLGLLMGLFLFSALLYVSDFGSGRSPDAGPAPAQSAPVATQDGAANQAGQPSSADSVMTWIFGTPD